MLIQTNLYTSKIHLFCKLFIENQQKEMGFTAIEFINGRLPDCFYSF